MMQIGDNLFNLFSCRLGNVMSHHKTIKDFEQYYKNVGDKKEVKEFLQNITSDKEG